MKCILFLLAIRCGGKIFRVSLNLTVPLGSGQTISGTGFNFKPVQTSRRAVSDPLPELPALLQQNTVTHLKHFNVSIMTQMRYKALLIR